MLQPRTSRVDLSKPDSRGYSHGRPFWVRGLWLVVEALTLLNPLFVFYRPKIGVLRLFGATIGRKLLIKPMVHIKHPWMLTIGDNVWLGERLWIDNLAPVEVGNNVCISQGAYLCTGNHDWSDPNMALIVAPIVVEDGAWIGAFAKIAPGVLIASESVITIGAVVLQSTEPAAIYAGNPASKVKNRKISDH